MPPLIHHKEHVTDVYANATSKERIEKNVARKTVPVAIEGQTNKPTLTVEHGRATVSARNVVVGEETKVQIIRGLIGETAESFDESNWRMMGSAS